jgi:hypothetical protein
MYSTRPLRTLLYDTSIMNINAGGSGHFSSYKDDIKNLEKPDE